MIKLKLMTGEINADQLLMIKDNARIYATGNIEIIDAV